MKSYNYKHTYQYTLIASLMVVANGWLFIVSCLRVDASCCFMLLHDGSWCTHTARKWIWRTMCRGPKRSAARTSQRFVRRLACSLAGHGIRNGYPAFGQKLVMIILQNIVFLNMFFIHIFILELQVASRFEDLARGVFVEMISMRLQGTQVSDCPLCRPCRFER